MLAVGWQMLGRGAGQGWFWVWMPSCSLLCYQEYCVLLISGVCHRYLLMIIFVDDYAAGGRGGGTDAIVCNGCVGFDELIDICVSACVVVASIYTCRYRPASTGCKK